MTPTLGLTNRQPDSAMPDSPAQETRRPDSVSVTADLRGTLREMSGSELLWISAHSNARTRALVEEELDSRSASSPRVRADARTSSDREWVRRALGCTIKQFVRVSVA